MTKLRRFFEDNTCYHVVTTARGRGQVFADPHNAQLIVDALQHLRRRCHLLAYAVMPDHVHAVVAPKNGEVIPRIMKSLKGYTSRLINARAERRGPLWQQSFYDRMIRSERQLWQTIEYVHNNPVAAGLVEAPEGYRFSSAGRDRSVDLAEFFGQ